MFISSHAYQQVKAIMEVKRFLPVLLTLYFLLAVTLVYLFTRKVANFNLIKQMQDHRLASSHRVHVNNSAELSFEDIKFATLFDDIEIKDLSDYKLKVIYNQTLLEAYFDDRAKFYIFADAFQGTNYLPLAKDPVCVALTISLEEVPQIGSYLQNWPGTTSVAVHVSSINLYFAIIIINHLRMCNRYVENQVNWHLVMPRNFTPPMAKLGILRTELNCSVDTQEIYKMLNTMFNRNKEKSPVHLPINMMRNVAKTRCRNEWIVFPEIHMMFPREKRINSDLTEFLREKNKIECVKCAFALPVYDIIRSGVPENKIALLELLSQGKALAHKPGVILTNENGGNLSFWEKLPIKEKISVAEKIEIGFPSEPIYITRHDAPKFDERYLGHSWTRSTQALEMKLAGFRFFLLDSIFLAHMNSSKEHHGNANIEVNTKTFTHHLRELSLKYDKYLEDLNNLYPYENPRKVNIQQESVQRKIV